MRMRNVKNKEEILKNSDKFISNPTIYKGKWLELFNNTNPIYIEIGMGKGKFILENALKYPDINFIGIEKYDTILAKAIPKIDKSITNLYIVRMDAKDIDLVFDKEISKIYLNFSDPWPKDRHQKRRLTSSVFLEKYDKIFTGKKIINLRTDNSLLFSYSIEALSNYGYVLNDVTFDLHKVKDKFITTEYEDKFVSEGYPIYELLAVKK